MSELLKHTLPEGAKQLVEQLTAELAKDEKFSEFTVEPYGCAEAGNHWVMVTMYQDEEGLQYEGPIHEFVTPV